MSRFVPKVCHEFVNRPGRKAWITRRSMGRFGMGVKLMDGENVFGEIKVDVSGCHVGKLTNAIMLGGDYVTMANIEK